MDTIETFKPVYQRFFREWHDRSRFLQVLKLTRKPLLLLAGKNPKGSNSAKWKLYEIERKADDEQMDYGQREQLRFDLALPILHALEVWLKKEYPKVLPKSPIGKAISFALKRFNRLCRYCGDGRFQIDNNLIENGQRKVALGRKNYLVIFNTGLAECLPPNRN